MEEKQFIDIVRHAWLDYDSSRDIRSIQDISAQVSTNHVYKVTLPDKEFVIAKLSYYGKYEHFCADHLVINTLSNNLPYPYENFLSRAFMKGKEIFIYRYQKDGLDAWVIFYRPVKIKGRLPKRLNEDQIQRLGRSFAKFHLASDKIRHTLPSSQKSLRYDIYRLMDKVREGETPGSPASDALILEHTEAFLMAISHPDVKAIDRIPIFVDWNIGNFSMTPSLRLFSRWDYDWFRVSLRVLDFYFFSRIVSDVGDRTYFHYLVEPLMEDRFALFLKAYHEIFPLTKTEIYLLKEAYRFFILNYVIKDGNYFFKDIYSRRLQKEAIELYLPSVHRFKPDKLLKILDL